MASVNISTVVLGVPDDVERAYRAMLDLYNVGLYNPIASCLEVFFRAIAKSKKEKFSNFSDLIKNSCLDNIPLTPAETEPLFSFLKTAKLWNDFPFAFELKEDMTQSDAVFFVRLASFAIVYFYGISRDCFEVELLLENNKKIEDPEDDQALSAAVEEK